MICTNISLILNSMGFNGQDIDNIYDNSGELMNYDFVVGKKWFPSAVDNTFFILSISLGIALGTIPNSFLNEFGKDLYAWSKNTVKRVFSGKEIGPIGNLSIEFKDCKINIGMTYEEQMSKLFEDLSSVCNRLKNIGVKGNVTMNYDEDNNKWEIELHKGCK